MIRLPSMSSLDLALHCTASLDVPPEKQLEPHEGPSYLRVANGTHACVEGILGGARAADCLAAASLKYGLTAVMQEQVRKRVERFGEWWLRRVGSTYPAPAWCEVAYAVNPRAGTSRKLKTEYHRDYRDAKPGELCGTADIVLHDRKPKLLIDIKAGFFAVTPPPRNGQLRGLGYAVARECGDDSIRVMVLKLDIDAATEIPSRDCVLDVFDLDDIETELCRLVDEVERGAPVERPGRWCSDNWCKRKKQCAGYAAAQRAEQGAA